MGLKVIITGATGMAGEGVTRQCLADPSVEKILLVGRHKSGIAHPKVQEVLVPRLKDIAQAGVPLAEYDACLFLVGVSSVGMKEAEYSALTYDLTIDFAKAVHAENPDITFCYISGAGTDSSEKGRMMWARVKGRTENQLLAMFRKAYMFRPGYMQPDRGARHTLRYYRYVQWMYPLLRLLFPRSVSRLSELARAMIACAAQGYGKQVLKVPDIVRLARQH